MLSGMFFNNCLTKLSFSEKENRLPVLCFVVRNCSNMKLNLIVNLLHRTTVIRLVCLSG